MFDCSSSGSNAKKSAILVDRGTWGFEGGVLASNCSPICCRDMILNNTDLESLIAAYEHDTGEVLSMEEAGEAARRVLAFFELLVIDPCPDKTFPVP